MLHWFWKNQQKPKMQPAMSSEEIDLFRKALAESKNYLEFGCGGSTVLACEMVKRSVTSVDSSLEWIESVRAACKKLSIRPRIHHVDLGEIGDWGWPTDETRRKDWPRYHSDIWEQTKAKDIDFCLVDGRFRVACFLQALLHLPPSTNVAMHDFNIRPEYHPVLDFADEIENADTFSVFRRSSSFNPDKCMGYLKQYEHIRD